MSNHVWIVEYGSGKSWKPDPNKVDESLHHPTRKIARDHKECNHFGHPRNLRVRKYVREEK